MKNHNKIEIGVPYNLTNHISPKQVETKLVKILLLDGEKRVVFLDGSHESVSLYKIKGKLIKV